jgi:glucose-1-phosphate cytidylyltransferase
MKAVILAGGAGTRLAEETALKPKPMVEVGGKPVLWHIMKMYATHGINDFIVCCGYKGHVIKEYFANYYMHHSDVTFSLIDNKVVVNRLRAEPWTVTLVDTGDHSMTGGRIKRVSKYIENDKAFCLTYGDGVSSVNIASLIEFHSLHGKEATLTATYPAARFGALELNGDSILEFREKPKGDGAMINAGFFVLSPNVLDRIDGDHCIWEQEPLMGLARDGQLRAFRHEGFWQPMDTIRDKTYLEDLWASKNPPWKTWDD